MDKTQIACQRRPVNELVLYLKALKKYVKARCNPMSRSKVIVVTDDDNENNDNNDKQT